MNSIQEPTIKPSASLMKKSDRKQVMTSGSPSFTSLIKGMSASGEPDQKNVHLSEDTRQTDKETGPDSEKHRASRPVEHFPDRKEHRKKHATQGDPTVFQAPGIMASPSAASRIIQWQQGDGPHQTSGIQERSHQGVHNIMERLSGKHPADNRIESAAASSKSGEQSNVGQLQPSADHPLPEKLIDLIKNKGPFDPQHQHPGLRWANKQALALQTGERQMQTHGTGSHPVHPETGTESKKADSAVASGLSVHADVPEIRKTSEREMIGQLIRDLLKTGSGESKNRLAVREAVVQSGQVDAGSVRSEAEKSISVLKGGTGSPTDKLSHPGSTGEPIARAADRPIIHQPAKDGEPATGLLQSRTGKSDEASDQVMRKANGDHSVDRPIHVTDRSSETNLSTDTFTGRMSKVALWLAYKSDTPADASPAQQSVRQQVVDQVSSWLNKASFRLSANSGQGFTMTLYPEQLGQLTVSVSQSADGMIAKLIASSSEARDLLESGIRQLKQDFASRGVPITQIDVTRQWQTAMSDPVPDFVQNQRQQSRHGGGQSGRDEEEEERRQMPLIKADNEDHGHSFSEWLAGGMSEWLKLRV